ncbi:Amyloid protein-binding protein 2 [Goodea atripinnis]|uniref:Amyloid protein-binding protein 2 n=1 Tax=Goodea atripinnis TaxID=208336 RepID=A0ABV0NPG0_9TELE
MSFFIQSDTCQSVSKPWEHECLSNIRTQMEESDNITNKTGDNGKKLFGEGYSGLEYDYRGLIKLYNSVGNYEKVFEYHNVLSNWNRLRDRQFAVADALEDVNTTPQQTQEVVQTFLQAQSLGPSRPCLG